MSPRYGVIQNAGVRPWLLTTRETPPGSLGNEATSALAATMELTGRHLYHAPKWRKDIAGLAFEAATSPEERQQMRDTCEPWMQENASDSDYQIYLYGRNK